LTEKSLTLIGVSDFFQQRTMVMLIKTYLYLLFCSLTSFKSFNANSTKTPAPAINPNQIIQFEKTDDLVSLSFTNASFPASLTEWLRSVLKRESESPSSKIEQSIQCSSTFGPAREPSLVIKNTEIS